MGNWLHQEKINAQKRCTSCISKEKAYQKLPPNSV